MLYHDDIILLSILIEKEMMLCPQVQDQRTGERTQCLQMKRVHSLHHLIMVAIFFYGTCQPNAI